MAGGVLAWLGLLPLLSILGQYITEPFPPIHPNFAVNPATGRPFLLSEMDPGQLWSAYIRYIGAGGVLAAGSDYARADDPVDRRVGARQPSRFLGGAAAAGTGAGPNATYPWRSSSAGRVLLAIFLAVTPGLPTQGNIVAAILILIFGFFFATVSSRITGLIGSSSNPISGMTIATLILTCLLVRCARLDWRHVLADRAVRRRDRVHCRRKCGDDLAGPEDRLHRRCDAGLPADWTHHRRTGVRPHHRIDDAVHARGVWHRIGRGAGAAGDPDGDDHHRPPEPEPALGAGAGRHLHRR